MIILEKKESYAPLSKEQLLEQEECCGSGCTNCPYEPRHEKGARNISKL
ncbi:hypothetical protein J4401_04095 [Candidatus Woesearchaeota archaeon]|nr:hypothetical protein [Candidatus Woesearchaeota archaeon]